MLEGGVIEQKLRPTVSIDFIFSVSLVSNSRPRAHECSTLPGAVGGRHPGNHMGLPWDSFSSFLHYLVALSKSENYFCAPHNIIGLLEKLFLLERRKRNENFPC